MQRTTKTAAASERVVVDFDEKKEETIQYFKQIGEITRNIYNILDNTNYLITKKLCMIIFHKWFET